MHGKRRTFGELQSVLRQLNLASSGTKPVSEIKTGFLSGGSIAKGKKLTDTQKAKRAEIKQQIRTARQNMRKSGQKPPPTDVQNMRKNVIKNQGNPNTPSIPGGPRPQMPEIPQGRPLPKPGRPFPNGNQTPPTKPPVDRTATMSHAQANTARQAALMNRRHKFAPSVPKQPSPR